MHTVLLGGTTYDLVRGVGLPDKAISRRFVRIKHHSDLVEAFEYDPFFDEPVMRARAIDAFRKCANIERVEQRWHVHDPAKIKLWTDAGLGELVNFSHAGLSVRISQLLAKGTRICIELDGSGGMLKSLLAREGMEVLHGEVRWGYAEATSFVHGIHLSHLNGYQSDALVQYLCEFAFARDAMNQGLRHGAKKSPRSA